MSRLRKWLVGIAIGAGIVLATSPAWAFDWSWDTILIIWIIIDRGGDVGDFWWW